ncbi:MAG: S8 family serine peptidase [Methanotrichaceae archaeon]|nr:S8 family serine peptidase [Methanotrichaceae archaeon]
MEEISGKLSTSLNDPKIDSELADLMNKKGEAPVIVILSGKERPNLEDFKIKYDYWLINGVAGKATSQTIKKLADIESVKGIYYDSIADVKFSEENISDSNFVNPARNINADMLWKKGIDGKGVVVAVIDSGIDDNHPDLIDKVVDEKNFVEEESSTDDFLGHGTMVAGIIVGSGAASEGKYMGIAPGAKLLNVKVIDRNGNGRISDIIAGIEWALYNDADILSLSLGGMNLGETNPPITMAADKAMDAGAVVCVAAGNHNSTKLESISGLSIKKPITADIDINPIRSSQIKDNKNDNPLLLLVPIVLALPPSLIDSPGDGVKVVTVGASDSQGFIADFSGSGPIRDGRTKPTVVGPGVNIVSTVPPGLEHPDYLDIYYARESGTSLSTPVAAGLAALLLQANPNLTPAGIKAAMTLGAVKLNNTIGDQYEEYYQGSGHLNALRSYELLGQDLCGVEPNSWVAGKWAYLPAGKALYVGLDIGADRPQKKLYALAPQDEDWTSKFVFFTDKERKDIEIIPSGEVSEWISLQPLPRNIPANGQKVFSASLEVPNGTLPGIYRGSIDIKNKGKIIFTIPVTVQVAEPIEIAKGQAIIRSILQNNQWHYYYLGVPLGTSDLQISLTCFNKSVPDLFLLSPTSEYFTGEQKGQISELRIEDPVSGQWLLAIHGKKMSLPENYTLRIERSLINSFPKRWSVNTAFPGSTTTIRFDVLNHGPEMNDMKYNGVRENITAIDFQASVTIKELWDSVIDVQPGTNRISARLDSEGESNESQLLLLFENPNGDPVDADLGAGNLGPIEIIQPEVGKWKVRVYGYEIPRGAQAFRLKLIKYAKEDWNWISAFGPKRLESDSNATIDASLRIPENTSVNRLDGYIEIHNSNESFQIPVSIKIAQASLDGLNYTTSVDSDNDSFYDKLSLGFTINSTSTGKYRIEGILTDCSGNLIERITKRCDAQQNSTTQVDISGKKIWEVGKCGPLHIKGLMLYNEQGELLDRFKGSITLKMNPQEFQPPPAYFTGSFENKTTTGKIAIGVGLSIIKPGSYKLSSRLEDDRGEELGKDSSVSSLQPGNTTLTMDFNPTKFMMLGRNSKLYLKDLTISMNGTDLDSLDDAWSSGIMSPEAFT